MINVRKLHRELVSAGIPIYGCSSEGRIDFKLEVTQAQKVEANNILANHSPYDYASERRKAYPPLGDQLDHLFWALKKLRDSLGMDWDGIDEWFKKLQTVKDKYPK